MEAEPTRRNIAIGDIHGCDQALLALLDAIQPAKSDRIITLGDYVDRGPGTPQVVDRLLKLRNECQFVPLMGNHEIMLISALEDVTHLKFWLGSGGQRTVDAYGGDVHEIPDAHLEFLNNCLPYFEGDDFFCVHANYTPTLPLDKQPDYALYWEHLDTFFPSPHISGKTAVVGHTPQRHGQILQTEHLICLDTYCYGGGRLSAIELTSGALWQASFDGEILADHGSDRVGT